MQDRGKTPRTNPIEGEDMENQAADALMAIFGMKRVDEDKRKEIMLEAMRQASEDQRKVLDKWTANAQDSNKIYFKG